MGNTANSGFSLYSYVLSGKCEELGGNGVPPKSVCFLYYISPILKGLKWVLQLS